MAAPGGPRAPQSSPRFTRTRVEVGVNPAWRVWCALVCTGVSELRPQDSGLISLAGLNPGGRSHTHEK